MSKSKTVTLPHEVAQQALEALEEADLLMEHRQNVELRRSALVTLRAALEAQVEQEPVAEHDLKDVRCECCGYMTHHREHMGCIRAAHTKREPPTTEQSSAVGVIGWKNHRPNSGTVVHWTTLMPPLWTKLYTRPQNLRCKSTQARLATLWGYVKAEPLTLEQIAVAFGWKKGCLPLPKEVQATRAIERAHGIGGEA